MAIMGTDTMATTPTVIMDTGGGSRTRDPQTMPLILPVFPGLSSHTRSYMRDGLIKGLWILGEEVGLGTLRLCL